MKEKMKRFMQKDPGLMKEMMSDPNHALAMAYRHNLISFARALKMTAEEGETVPPEIARTAVEEMKRSVDGLERQHSKTLASMPEEKRKRLGDLPVLMERHVADIKAGIEQLDKLVKKDTIPSDAVLTDLRQLVQACNAGMKGMPGARPMDDHGMMPNHECLAESEARDAELMKLIDRMNEASGAEKMRLMSDVVTRLAKQQPELKSPLYGRHWYGMKPCCKDCGYRCSGPCPAPPMNDDDEDEGNEE
jgi:hypothetical protein